MNEREGVLVAPNPDCRTCGRQGRYRYRNLRDDYGGAAPGAWDIRECVTCGLMWLDPQPLPSELPKLYQIYHTHHAEEISITEPLGIWKHNLLLLSLGYSDKFWRAFQFDSRLPKILIKYRESIEGLIRILLLTATRLRAVRDYAAGAALWLGAEAQTANAAKPLVLDVGCGSGDLGIVLQRFGWQVEGTETDSAAAKKAEQRGLKVYQGFLTDLALEPGRYQAVTLAHVIEHVADPEEILRYVFRLLARGGKLVIVTPNPNSLLHQRFAADWRGIEAPRHFCIMEARALRKFASAAGFEIMECRSVSRTARHIFLLSKKIQRTRQKLSVANPILNKCYWVYACLLQVFEEILCYFEECGEETLLIARKPYRDA